MNIRNLEDLPADALWLEERGDMERWQIGHDEHGDGLTEWYCSLCGCLIEVDDEGCDCQDE